MDNSKEILSIFFERSKAPFCSAKNSSSNPAGPENTVTTPIHNECQSRSAMVLALLRERAHQDDFSDTLQPVSFMLASILWLEAVYPNSHSH